MNKKKCERLLWNIAGLIGIFALVFVLICCAGCAATQKQLAQNLQQKSLMGDGIIAVNKITVTSPETGTYTPELKSVFVSGKFLSLLKDANFMTYDRKSSASTFNASAITTTETLVIQTGKNGDLAAVIKQIGNLTRANTQNAPAAQKSPQNGK